METNGKSTYIFQGGKYKGRTLEWLFLNDPVHLGRIYVETFRNGTPVKNALGAALENFQERIRGLRAKIFCPFCQMHPVSYLLIPDSGKINERLISCDRDICRNKLAAVRPGRVQLIKQILPLIGGGNISSNESKTVLRIFKQVYKDYTKELS